MNNIDYSFHYRCWHNDSIEHYEASAQFYNRILKLSSIAKESAILDLGCGTGLLVYALRKFGVENVIGIDVSRQQIEEALKHGLPCKQVNEDFIFRYAEENEGIYDIVFMLDVLEHVPKVRHIPILSAVHQLLRPGGKLWISVPNANSTFAMRWQFIDWTHELSFSEHSLEFIILNSGFTDVRHHSYEFIMKPRLHFILKPSAFYWLLNRIFRALRRLQAVAEIGSQGWSIPLSLNLLVECRKPS